MTTGSWHGVHVRGRPPVARVASQAGAYSPALAGHRDARGFRDGQSLGCGAGVLIHRPRGPNDLREPTRRPSIRGIGHCVVGDAVRPVASGAVLWWSRRGVGRGQRLLPPRSAADALRRCPREGGRVQVEGELERLHCRAAGDRELSHAGRRRRLVGRAGRPGTRPLGLLRPAPDQYATAPALESTHRPSAVLHA